MIRSRSRGNSERIVLTGGWQSFTIEEITDAGEDPSNGRRPVAISYKTTPREKMSVR